MKTVNIPIKWLSELIALCGPEDHELRERVMVSTSPKAQADALDAQRYRWLRDQGSLAEGSRHPQSWRCVAMLADMGGEHADTAIDAAIAAAKENK